MFQIDLLSRVPVYEQLIKQTENFILTGVLVPNSQMPSVRSLSLKLSVNPNTIQKAYAELDRRGIVYSVPGRGSFISENAREILSLAKQSRLKDLDDIVKELSLAGIARDTVLEHVNKIYDLKGAIL